MKFGITWKRLSTKMIVFLFFSENKILKAYFFRELAV